MSSKFISQAEHYGIVNDRILDDTLSLPNTLDECKIKINSPVTKATINNSLSRLQENFIDLLANARISNTRVPFNQSSVVIVANDSFRYNNIQSNLRSDSNNTLFLCNDVVGTRTSDNLATVNIFASNNLISMTTTSDRNENLSTASISNIATTNDDDYREGIVLDISGLTYDGVYSTEWHREAGADTVFNATNGEYTNLMAQYRFALDNNIERPHEPGFIAAVSNNFDPDGDSPFHETLRNTYVNRNPYLSGDGEPYHYIQKTTLVGDFRWVFVMDPTQVPLLDPATGIGGVHFNVGLFGTKEDVTSPDQASLWEPIYPESDNRYVSLSELNINQVNRFPNGDENNGIHEINSNADSDLIEFSNIKSVELDANKRLLVLDDTNIYKYDIDSMVSYSTPVEDTDQYRNLISSIGGNGSVTSKSLFSNPTSMSVFHTDLLVLDTNGIDTFVKSYDNNFNFKSIVNVTSKLESKTAVDVLAYDNEFIILVDDGTIIHYIDDKFVNSFAPYNQDYQPPDDKYLRLRRSQENENVFYILTSRSVIKKYKSKLDKIIGKYTDVNSNFTGLSVVPSINGNYDQLYVVSSTKQDNGIMFRFLDKTNYFESVDTRIHDQIFDLDEIKIKDEAIDALTYNKAISKIKFNLSLLAENALVNVESEYGNNGPSISRVIYPNTETLNKIDSSLDFDLLGQNEIVASSTINRIIEDIYNTQTIILETFSGNFSNEYPLNWFRVVFGPTGPEWVNDNPVTPDVPPEDRTEDNPIIVQPDPPAAPVEPPDPSPDPPPSLPVIHPNLCEDLGDGANVIVRLSDHASRYGYPQQTYIQPLNGGGAGSLGPMATISDDGTIFAIASIDGMSVNDTSSPSYGNGYHWYDAFEKGSVTGYAAVYENTDDDFHPLARDPEDHRIRPGWTWDETPWNPAEGSNAEGDDMPNTSLSKMIIKDKAFDRWPVVTVVDNPGPAYKSAYISPDGTRLMVRAQQDHNYISDPAAPVNSTRDTIMPYRWDGSGWVPMQCIYYVDRFLSTNNLTIPKGNPRLERAYSFRNNIKNLLFYGVDDRSSITDVKFTTSSDIAVLYDSNAYGINATKSDGSYYDTVFNSGTITIVNEKDHLNTDTGQMERAWFEVLDFATLGKRPGKPSWLNSSVCLFFGSPFPSDETVQYVSPGPDLGYNIPKRIAFNSFRGIKPSRWPSYKNFRREFGITVAIATEINGQSYYDWDSVFIPSPKDKSIYGNTLDCIAATPNTDVIFGSYEFGSGTVEDPTRQVIKIYKKDSSAESWSEVNSIDTIGSITSEFYSGYYPKYILNAGTNPTGNRLALLVHALNSHKGTGDRGGDYINKIVILQADNPEDEWSVHHTIDLCEKGPPYPKMDVNRDVTKIVEANFAPPADGWNNVDYFRIHDIPA